MQPTLLILAAGMATRYGSMKQTQAFGPDGETIMDYSIYDAIQAGFGKVVFVIREDFAEYFKAIFEPKLKGRIATAYVYQELTDNMHGQAVPDNRKKPWGTAHAVLSATDAISEPFAVINADDFYGSDAFEKAAAFLQNECNEKNWSIIGYELRKTLSENGTVSRGVCEVNETGQLVSIVERIKIYSEADKLIYEDENGKHEMSSGTKVSMNFWCMHQTAFAHIDNLFRDFVRDNSDNPKAEFFIPLIAQKFIDEGGVIELIPTGEQWFGVTYKEDAPVVQETISQLVSSGKYPEALWK
ncbi:MAG: sugar phosphate nucleotidyltransferase [Chitinophagaceae bacterium]